MFILRTENNASKVEKVHVRCLAHVLVSVLEGAQSVVGPTLAAVSEQCSGSV